jgi:hypothetical protein
MTETNGNNEGKIRKVLFNEVTAFVALVSIVIGIFNWVGSPQKQTEKDIALIQQDIKFLKENHLAHIETKLVEICNKNDEQDKMINEINLKVTEILTILKK